jgi:hypothetical protein
MVTHDGGSSLNFLAILFVVLSQILTVIYVKSPLDCATTCDKQVKRAANMVEEIDQPFTASVLHWTFFEIMTD